MQSGMVRLESLYKFVREYVEQHPDRIDAYSIERSSKHGKVYRDKNAQILEKVPDEQGFYLWGFYNPSRFWINVYSGKAGKGKTASLRARLLEELKDERACIWREVNPDNATLLGIGKRTHPQMWHKYEKDWKRTLGKAGSTHIFWVAAPPLDLEPDNVESFENDLIEVMNPTGNRRRIMPAPALQQKAANILNAFRDMIHSEENRKGKFPLDYHDELWKWVGQAEPPTP
jgi:hypothetical protein